MNQTNLHQICRLSLCFFIVALSVINPRFAIAESIEGDTKENAKLQLPAGRLAILPFIKGDFTEQIRAKKLSPLTCPINQVCIDLNDGDEASIFMENLDKDLHRMLKKKLDTDLFPMEDTKTQFDTLPVDTSKDNTLSMALKLAEKMKSDYVLVTILWDYSERIGTKFAAEKAASVSFALYLVSAKQEKTVWKANFNKTQQALTDNLLKAKDIIQFGGKWVTAEKLAQIGMQKILEDFPMPAI